MQFQISSSNPALIPVSNLFATRIDSNYTLHYSPLPNQSGNATINVTANDGYGGTVSFSFMITVYALPVVGSTSMPSPNICEGELLILNGTGASTYTWSGGISNNTAFIPPPGSSTYIVTGTNANG